MLDHIEASDRRLRRFIADASHELRTPLAAVRAYAELFGRGAAARPEDLERSMSGITREAERMSLLVDDLLLLARLDEGRPLERSPSTSRRSCGRLSTPLASSTRTGRSSSPTEPAIVMGDATGLRQVIDNLLANVTRAHARRNAASRSSFGVPTAAPSSTVADRGPGTDARRRLRASSSVSTAPTVPGRARAAAPASASPSSPP